MSISKVTQIGFFTKFKFVVKKSSKRFTDRINVVSYYSLSNDTRKFLKPSISIMMKPTLIILKLYSYICEAHYTFIVWVIESM